VGGRMSIMINVDNVHIFDTDTEVSLTYEFKKEQAAAAR